MLGALVVNVLVPTSPSLAAPGDIILASTSDDGVKGNGDSTYLTLSADGTTVAFLSTATNLDPADTDAVHDVYVKNLATGDIVLASTSDSGQKANGTTFFFAAPALSSDGTKVAFSSAATNLDPADTDTLPDVYVKDLTTGDIVLASTSDSGEKSNGLSDEAVLSADGRTVAFPSFATNLDPADTDLVADMYVKDLTTGDIVLASTSDSGEKGVDSSLRPVLSPDGSKVAFSSIAYNLDPLANEFGFYELFVKDLTTGDIMLATVQTGKEGDSVAEAFSGDGTKVVFQSYADGLVPDDVDFFVSNIYLYDLTTGTNTLVSTSAAGEKGNGSSHYPALSADGTKVAFNSISTNLSPGDQDFDDDVYVKDLTTGQVTLASTSSGGLKGNGGSDFVALSADGASVAFSSLATNLHPDDTDTIRDVYVKEISSSPAGPSISVADAERREGPWWYRRMVFRVTLSAPSDVPVTAHYTTVDGTAAARSDFRARSGTITFHPGRTRAQLVILVVGDRREEPDETFSIELSSPTNATISDGTATGTIFNDDLDNP